MRAALLVLALALLPGCIATTHVSPTVGAQRYKSIAWQPDFETAHKQSLATGKPLLTIVAAGAKNGFC